MPANAADLVLAKGLPTSTEAEQFVLGSILLDDELFPQVAGALEIDDFSLEKHRRIFARMVDLNERGERIEYLTLVTELEKHDQLHSVDGIAYIASLNEGLPRLASIDSYVKIVKDKSLLRKLIFTSQMIISNCIEGGQEADDLLAEAESAIMKVGDAQLRSGLSDPRKIVEDFSGGIRAFLDPSKRIKGISTGFLKFDERTTGLHEGELIIIAARPSMGKTALALNIAQHVAMGTADSPAKPVAVFSLEMSKESLLSRMLCATARVDSHRFRGGFLNPDERRRLNVALNQLVQSKLFLDDSATTNVMEISAKCRRLRSEHGLGLVIIDYMQLMASKGRFENRNAEISAISRGLKLMSKDLGVPVIALSQLSRAPEMRQGDHRPQLSDLRESGCLTGSTLVVRADTGDRVPIQDLTGKSGFAIWALNEQTLKLERAMVSRVFPTGRKRVFRLTTRLGRSIEATANHQFRCFDGWKRLDQLCPGDRIALPRCIPAQPKQTLPDAQLALLGHLIGDGCTLPRHTIQYTTREEELAKLVSNLAVEVFGGEVSPRINRERRWYQVYLASTRRHTHRVHSAVSDWLSAHGVFGIRSHQKFAPEAIFRQPPEAIATFLRHLWATDGCLNVKKTDERRYPAVYYATSSPRLARDVQSLLLRVGINAILVEVPQGTKGRLQFHVKVSGGPDLARFVDVVGAAGSRRQAVLGQLRGYLSSTPKNTNRDVIPNLIWRRHAVPAMQQSGVTTRQMMKSIQTAYCGTSLYKQNVSRERAAKLAAAVVSMEIAALAESDVYWDQLDSIQELADEEVFDLTVPGRHNFIANDIIVHNSIEQDADLVGFIFREEVYKPDREDLHGLAELIIAKQRNGPIGKIRMAFIHKFTKFENLAEDIDGGGDFDSGDE